MKYCGRNKQLIKNLGEKKKIVLSIRYFCTEMKEDYPKTLRPFK